MMRWKRTIILKAWQLRLCSALEQDSFPIAEFFPDSPRNMLKWKGKSEGTVVTETRYKGD